LRACADQELSQIGSNLDEQSNSASFQRHSSKTPTHPRIVNYPRSHQDLDSVEINITQSVKPIAQFSKPDDRSCTQVKTGDINAQFIGLTYTIHRLYTMKAKAAGKMRLNFYILQRKLERSFNIRGTQKLTSR
jgi:hypothetical protein